MQRSFKVFTDKRNYENDREKIILRSLENGAGRALKLSDADQSVHCYRALKQYFG